MGFEPTNPCGSTAFKAAAFVHSATAPPSIVPHEVAVTCSDLGEVPESGRSGLTANEVWASSPPRVRIPPSPPHGPWPSATGRSGRFRTSCDERHDPVVAFTLRKLTLCCGIHIRTRAGPGPRFAAPPVQPAATPLFSGPSRAGERAPVRLSPLPPPSSSARAPGRVPSRRAPACHEGSEGSWCSERHCWAVSPSAPLRTPASFRSFVARSVPSRGDPARGARRGRRQRGGRRAHGCALTSTGRSEQRGSLRQCAGGAAKPGPGPARVRMSVAAPQCQLP